MYALLCDTCRQPIDHEGFDLTLLRGTLVSSPGEVAHLSSLSGVISASLCSRCGERITAILRRKLQDPCPTCEVAPLRQGDERHAVREMSRRAG
jgi:hypothetical protein